MAIFLPDHWRRQTFTLLAATCLMLSASAADNPVADIIVDGTHPEFNADTLRMRDATLAQGASTVIRAAETSATGLSEGYKNSQWELRGMVHVEHEGAILDADTATVVFADGHLKSIHLQGMPANFSHQPKNSEQRNQGRAGVIDYDAVTGLVRFSGGTWYSNGRVELNTPMLTYNVNDGSYTNIVGTDDNSRFHMIIRQDKRVPPPRAPDRATAR
jgi:lipopolysaccharide transport protein LptA